MINYNIADLVSRINNVIATNGRNSLVNVPYTKDNYQVLIQLTKLGVLSITDNQSISHLYPAGAKSRVNYITAKLHSPVGKTMFSLENNNQPSVGRETESIQKSGLSFIPSLAAIKDSDQSSLTKWNFAPYPAFGGVIGQNPQGDKLSKGKLIQHKLKLKIISKPGRRVYISYNDLKDFNHGFKTYLLRTSKGIISSHTAINLKIGGELLIKLTIV